MKAKVIIPIFILALANAIPACVVPHVGGDPLLIVFMVYAVALISLVYINGGFPFTKAQFAGCVAASIGYVIDSAASEHTIADQSSAIMLCCAYGIIALALILDVAFDTREWCVSDKNARVK